MAGPGAPPPMRKWTVAVHLAVRLSDAISADKLASLRELATQTRGKPVMLLVQQLEPNPAYQAGFDSESRRCLVQRYEIADGRVTKVEPAQVSRGFAHDIKALLRDAGRDHPSARLGLVIDSHGEGQWGLSTDNGSASLAEVQQAIAAGLVGAGRPGGKLDLLDFDACLMGQAEVLAPLADVTEHLVASPEVEWATNAVVGRMANAQNLGGALGALLTNPALGGGQLGDAIVGASSKVLRQRRVNGRPGLVAPLVAEAVELRQHGVGPAPKVDRTQPSTFQTWDVTSGTPTLAHYDMAALPRFQRAMDVLGRTLTRAWADPTARQVITRAIEATPRYASKADSGEALYHQRDLGQFTDRLATAAREGKLPHAAGLLRATDEVHLARKELVASYHGDPTFAGYAQHAGIGVFLPVPRLLDVAARSAFETENEQRSSLRDLQNFKQADVARLWPDFKPGDPSGNAKVLDLLAAVLKECFVDDYSDPALVAAFDAARPRIAAASTSADVERVVDDLIATRRAYPQTPGYQAEIARRAGMAARSSAACLAESGLPADSGWYALIQAMCGGAQAP